MCILPPFEPPYTDDILNFFLAKTVFRTSILTNFQANILQGESCIMYNDLWSNVEEKGEKYPRLWDRPPKNKAVNHLKCPTLTLYENIVIRKRTT